MQSQAAAAAWPGAPVGKHPLTQHLRVSALAVFGTDTKAYPSLLAECTVGGLKLRTDVAATISESSTEWQNGSGAMQFPIKDTELQSVVVRILTADGDDTVLGSATIGLECKYILFPLIGPLVRSSSSSSSP